MKEKYVLLIAVFCCAAAKIFAQADMSDSLLSRQSIQNAIEVYYKSIGENAHLYNGSEYVPNNFVNSKNPYFEPLSSQQSIICYDGTVYNNVLLIYDIHREEVIINRYGQRFMIKLAREKIDWFSFPGHNFIRIVRDSSSKTLPGTGFYEKLYSGTVSVLAKRKKKIEETINSAGISTQFSGDDHIYIRKDGVYYPVRNKKSTLQVFRDSKKDIRRLLRKNKIKFKPDLEFGIVKAAQYYDQIKN